MVAQCVLGCSGLLDRGDSGEGFGEEREEEEEQLKRPCYMTEKTTSKVKFSFSCHLALFYYLWMLIINF